MQACKVHTAKGLLVSHEQLEKFEKALLITTGYMKLLLAGELTIDQWWPQC
jgi:hypothetical protein